MGRQKCMDSEPGGVDGLFCKLFCYFLSDFQKSVNIVFAMAVERGYADRALQPQRFNDECDRKRCFYIFGCEK